jgi:hypothetical protein
MTAVMPQDECMEQSSEDLPDQPEPAQPNREAGQASVTQKAPPASETWVEGQPASDADYREPDKKD